MLRPKRTKRVPAKQPFIAAEPRNAAPKGASLRAKLDEPRPFGAPRPIPQEILDEVAEKQFTGGYNTKRSNICNRCFTTKSRNGKCACV